jgi:hypothetical protein
VQHVKTSVTAGQLEPVGTEPLRDRMTRLIKIGRLDLAMSGKPCPGHDDSSDRTTSIGASPNTICQISDDRHYKAMTDITV